MNFLKNEVLYLFQYEGTEQGQYGTVNMVTGKRMGFSNEQQLNYSGSGITSPDGMTPEIYPELVAEQVSSRFSDGSPWYADLMFYLPDVQAHVLCSYRVEVMGDPSDPMTEKIPMLENFRFLNK